MSRREKSPFDDPSGGHEGRLLLALLIWIGIHGLTVWRLRPPAPLPANAPERAFSAGRAGEVLERLAAGLGPHPSGSPAAEELRQRLLVELQRIGLRPVVQEAVACGPYGTAGAMRNVVARLDGTGRGKATLLVAHYDSVGAGPGASDDLAGVAALVEIARALREGRRPERTVLFLFTDGEEDGLVGATAFVRSSPLADEVGVVLNVDARGRGGQSLMFETGADNAWLVDLYARSAPRPAATSVSAEVYRRMPNDSDFTVFRERGVPGLNFAFIEGVHVYHTPLDTVDELSRASLQHHGDSMLAVTRALDEAEIPARPSGDLVYADVLGVFVPRLRAGLAWPLALAALLGLVWGLARAARAGVLGFGDAAWGVLAVPVLVGVPAALAAGIAALLRLATGGAPWRAFAFPTAVAQVGVTLLALAALAPFLARLARVAGLAHGAWIAWGFAGAFLAIFVPGASYLFFLPAALAAFAALGMRLTGDVDARLGRAALCAVALAALLWTPLLLRFLAAFGAGNPASVALPLAFVGTLLTPILASVRPRVQRGLVGCGALLVLAGSSLALLLPARTAARPARMNLAYVLDASGAARWRVETAGRLPATVAAAGAFERGSRGEDDPRVAWYAPAPALPLAGPAFDVLEDAALEGGARRVRGTLRSPASAARTQLTVLGDCELESALASGVEVAHGGKVTWIAVGPEGVGLELLLSAPVERSEEMPVERREETPVERSEETPTNAPDEALADGPDEAPDEADEDGARGGVERASETLRLLLTDAVRGLPREGEVLAGARPAGFVPSGAGDVTVVESLVELGAGASLTGD